jgi:catechol 2,3-dioxygenase-like lactoylglutathione lyase family enzyme
MFGKVDHITIVVRDRDKTMKKYEDILRLIPGRKGFVKDFERNHLAMFTTADGARIEIIQVYESDDSPFSKFLAEHGEGVYSYCIYVEDFDTEIKRLKEKGIKLREMVQDFLFPDHPFRIAWIPAEEGLGVTVELVDAEAIPDFER